MLFLAITTAAVMTVGNYLRFRDVLYPPVLQAGIWLFALAVYAMHRDSFYDLSSEVCLFVANGIVLFAVGSYLVTYRFRRATPEPHASLPAAACSQWMLWLSLVGLPFFVLRAVELASSTSGDLFLVNIRTVTTAEDQDSGYGVLQYLLPVSFVACGIELYKHLQASNVVKLALAAGSAACYAVLSAGRANLLLLLLLMSGIAAMTRRVKLVTLGVWLALALTISLIATGLWLEKGLRANKDLTDNFQLMQQHLTVYVAGGLLAFDQLWQSASASEYGPNTLRAFYSGLQRLGMSVEVPPFHQEYVRIPMGFNTYTVYYPYYKDFGLPGVLLIQLFFGAWHGHLYSQADRGKPFYVFMYALFLFPLVMQFFHDNYFTLLSMWLQFSLLLALQTYHFVFTGIRTSLTRSAGS